MDIRLEHKNLSLEYDKKLIENILDNIDMRYIILFLYIIRNDLLKDLNDEKLIESYEKILMLDEIYKGNVTTFWDQDFTEIAIDLGLFKNIRSIREFEQKDDDYLIKMGENTVTVEGKTILVPDDTLFSMIHKKFKSLNRRNFNLSVTRLKSVRCETTGVIHPFLYQIGENDITLSDDLYYILDQFGNAYQAIKIEVTINGFDERFQEIRDKIIEFIELFDSGLNHKVTVNKIKEAIDNNKEIIKFLKKEKINLSDKFEIEEVNKESEIFNKWESTLEKLLNFRYQLDQMDNEIKDLKSIYSGKDKEYTYLEFIEKVSFNEDNIIDTIQDTLLKLRDKLIKIDKERSQYTKKEIKLLNLDFERYLITGEAI